MQKPDGNVSPVFPSALGKNAPEPFKSEPTSGGGAARMHKQLVLAVPPRNPCETPWWDEDYTNAKIRDRLLFA